MANKAALVEQVKALQKAGDDTKQQWWDYCDAELGGVRDPNRHDVATLEYFLSLMEEAGLAGGAAPVTSSSSKGKSKGGGGGGAGPPPRGAVRPGPVKGAQPRYGGCGPCGGYGGCFDGGYAGYGGPFGGGYAVGGFGYDAAAAAAYGYGGWGHAASSHDDLVEFVKMGQRRSKSWKTAWSAYCGLYGSAINDPMRHEQSFLVSFLDYVGGLAEADLGAIAASMEADDADAVGARPSAAEAPALPHKKTPGASTVPLPRQPSRTASGPMTPVGKSTALGGGTKRPPAGGGGERQPPQKKALLNPTALLPGGAGAAAGGGAGRELVDRVKALQRRDPETKQAWTEFTDSLHGGVRDPARHDQDTLLQFLAEHEGE